LISFPFFFLFLISFFLPSFKVRYGACGPAAAGCPGPAASTGCPGPAARTGAPPAANPGGSGTGSRSCRGGKLKKHPSKRAFDCSALLPDTRRLRQHTHTQRTPTLRHPSGHNIHNTTTQRHYGWNMRTHAHTHIYISISWTSFRRKSHRGNERSSTNNAA
jgi:hypothetical protein